METHRKAWVRLAADLTGSRQGQDSLRIQLRSQAEDIDRLEAENTEQREVIKTLRADLARLQNIQQADSHDLVHLAGRLLAVSHATGVELHNSTKALFRRRGWTATNRNPETQKP
jgi:chromosome segregation ATPase